MSEYEFDQRVRYRERIVQAALSEALFPMVQVTVLQPLGLRGYAPLSYPLPDPLSPPPFMSVPTFCGCSAREARIRAAVERLLDERGL